MAPPLNTNPPVRTFVRIHGNNNGKLEDGVPAVVCDLSKVANITPVHNLPQELLPESLLPTYYQHRAMAATSSTRLNQHPLLFHSHLQQSSSSVRPRRPRMIPNRSRNQRILQDNTMNRVQTQEDHETFTYRSHVSLPLNQTLSGNNNVITNSIPPVNISMNRDQAMQNTSLSVTISSNETSSIQSHIQPETIFSNASPVIQPTTQATIPNNRTPFLSSTQAYTNETQPMQNPVQPGTMMSRLSLPTTQSENLLEQNIHALRGENDMLKRRISLFQRILRNNDRTQLYQILNRLDNERERRNEDANT